ncbi:MAG: CBS domain-containing protein [Candidatus Promineifilaceae bacterium]|nr:CBS domain-containing protein [Candidatus Promineifilaceae bacterium]
MSQSQDDRRQIDEDESDLSLRNKGEERHAIPMTFATYTYTPPDVHYFPKILLWRKNMHTVNDLMTVAPLTVTPPTKLEDVVQMMRVEGCRQLPVVNEEGRLVGIITDRDVRLAVNSPLFNGAADQNRVLLTTLTVAECMTPSPLTVTPDTPAYRAAEMLIVFKVGALPVVEGERLVGILTISDVLDQFVSEQKRSLFTLEPTAEPAAETAAAF